MASITCNGALVLGAKLTLKLTGAWKAELDVDRTEALTGQVTISDGENHFVGTVVRGAVYSGRWKLTVVGGGGGLRNELSALPYKSTSVRFVLNDILSEIGEVLSSSADRSVLDRQLGFWHRSKGPAYVAIGSLLQDEIGANWRVQRDGSFWLGADQFLVQEVPHTIVSQDDALGVMTIAPESMALDVGRSFLDKTVRGIVYRLDANKLRAEVWFRESLLDDLLRERIQDILRESRYAKLYPAIAAKVQASGLADILPDNSEVADPSASENPLQPRGQTGVRVRAGLPGVRLELGKTERCLVGFEGASSARPYVAGWRNGSTKARIGQLLIAQNAITFALLPPQFFEAGEVSGLLAEAAKAAIILAGNTAFLVPIETSIWETR